VCESDFARKYVAEGKTEGKAEALSAILGARGLSVSEELRQRILACRDAAALDRWIARAATAASIEQALD
jgi:hypothetical protein